MMNNTILNHVSIRKFKNEPISKETLDTVLEGAIRASNTGNMQWYSIVVTTELALKQKLRKECHFNQAMIEEAPVVLTFCADLNRFNKWCKLNNTEPGYDNFLSFYTASIDATIAAQNACIAAESLGLGICYLGTTNYTAPKIIEILNLPKDVFPVTTVVLGYPDETPTKTDRLLLEAVVHDEVYCDYCDEDIQALYVEKENMEFYKELVKTNGTNSLAQIFTEKRYSKQNNVAFSKTLLDEIKKQGFMNQE